MWSELSSVNNLRCDQSQVACIKEVTSEKEKNMNWYSRRSRYKWRKNKLSARENKVIASQKQRPYRTASRMGLKQREKKDRRSCKILKLIKIHAAKWQQGRTCYIVEVWSLSSRICEMPGHSLWGSIKGWGCQQRLVWRVASHTPSLVVGYLVRRSVLNLRWLIWI